MIASLISGDSLRPSLAGIKSFVEEIEEIFEIRTPHYQTASNVTIPTDNENPGSIAKQILGNIELLT